ncbi:MAG: hypothetical protein ACXWKR_06495, partial [Phenylobacterium sp.]
SIFSGSLFAASDDDIAGVESAVGPAGAAAAAAGGVSSARAAPAAARASAVAPVRHANFVAFMVYPLFAGRIVQGAPEPTVLCHRRAEAWQINLGQPATAMVDRADQSLGAAGAIRHMFGRLLS